METLEHVVISLAAQDLRDRVLIDRTKQNAPRSPGVHLSGILKYLAYSPGGALADGKAQGEPSDFEETYPTVVACGHMWEEFCVSLYPSLIWQPGPRERNGIIGTPDGLNFGLSFKDLELDVLEEAKFTTKSMRTPDTWPWWWVRQGLGLCALHGLFHVRWHSLWAHGWYKGKRWEHLPVYTRTLVEFSEREVEGWWKVLVKNKDKAEPE